MGQNIKFCSRVYVEYILVVVEKGRNKVSSRVYGIVPQCTVLTRHKVQNTQLSSKILYLS